MSIISNQESLLAWRERASRQASGRVVLDLEADSLHRYQEKICLMQYGDEEGTCLIDPLALEDVRMISHWLEENQIWMHGADYDMSLMLMTFGHLPKMILDTQIAARLLGFRQFGLAALVHHFYGVELSKASQKADWGKRPLPLEMQEYALNDVNYMLSMADTLVAQLKEKNRYHWFIEICENNMLKAHERQKIEHTDSWRIRGSGKLNRRGLAALQKMWGWRDKEAALWDRPAFMVCSNDSLLQWSILLQESKNVQAPLRFSPKRLDRFYAAVQSFQCLDEEDYPERIIHPRRHHDDQFEDRLKIWMDKRDVAATSLGIEPSFIASRAVLEAIADKEEEGLALLLSWQKEALDL